MTHHPAAAPHPPASDPHRGEGASDDRDAALAEGVRRLLDAYPRIYFACHQRHVRDPEGGELSASQASILSHLDPVDPTRVSDLADHLGVTVSTMSLSVKRLERDGYVRRDPDPDDGRVVQLRLTEDGERMRAARSVLEPVKVRALLARMDAAGREEGLAGLERLAEAADALVRSDGPADRAEPTRGRDDGDGDAAETAAAGEVE